MEPSASSGRGEGEVVAGQFRLVRRIGRGGMGEVWRARHLALDVDVAVKLIHLDAGAEAQERLLREARAAARLGDPAIVHILDFGRTAQGSPFIAMEYLEGEDLANLLAARGKVDPTRAVRLLLPIAHALAMAHDRGIVHRDLKPENVFLARLPGDRLQPKLLDFGVARVASVEGVRLTQAGELLGSPSYMSPEQAAGDEVGATSDVWSFCVVLHELATGRRPFDGRNPLATLLALHSGSGPPPIEAGPELEGLDAAIARGLSRDPSARPTMRALGRELADWLLSRGATDDVTGTSLRATWVRDVEPEASSEARPPGRRSRGWMVAAAVAGLVVAAAGLVGRSRPPAPPRVEGTVATRPLPPDAVPSVSVVGAGVAPAAPVAPGVDAGAATTSPGGAGSPALTPARHRRRPAREPLKDPFH